MDAPLSTALRARDLPAAVWRLEAGSLLNATGSGFVMPFSFIYFHDVRGFSLGVSGLITATFSFAPLLGTPGAGALVDRIGARSVLIGSLVLCAIGAVLFALAHAPWEGFAAATVGGLGSGSVNPSQSSLIGLLAPERMRHLAFSLQRTTTNLGYGIGGLLGGLIASTSDPGSFVALFVIDGATFALFAVAVLAFVEDRRHQYPGGGIVTDAVARGYRAVLGHRPLLGVLALNAVLCTAGMAMFEAVLPVYAHNFGGVSETAIGIFFSINTGLIVILQLPLARRMQGRRRMRGVQLVGVMWAAGTLVVLLGASAFTGLAAAAVIAVGVVLWTVGECMQTAVITPLVADLAPPQLLGRFLALGSVSWAIGFALAPAVAGFALSASATATWVGAAVVCLASVRAAAVLERALPPGSRRTGDGTAAG